MIKDDLKAVEAHRDALDWNSKVMVLEAVTFADGTIGYTTSDARVHSDKAVVDVKTSQAGIMTYPVSSIRPVREKHV